MNYKDIEFTIENAEKYPDAVLIRQKDECDNWQLGIKRDTLFAVKNNEWGSDWLAYSIDYCARKFKLRIPLEFQKRKLYYDNIGISHSGYSIYIDENGNPVGEPFKTEL